MLGGHFPCDASATRLVLTHNYWLFLTENLFARLSIPPTIFQKRLAHFSTLSREFWVYKHIVCFKMGLLRRWRGEACYGLGGCFYLWFLQQYRSPRSWAVSASRENTPNLNCKYPKSIGLKTFLPFMFTETKATHIMFPVRKCHYIIINKGGLFDITSFSRFYWNIFRLKFP